MAAVMDVEEDRHASNRKWKYTSDSDDSSGSTDSEDEEFIAEIVFALDYSSYVSEEDFERQFDFAHRLARSLDATPSHFRIPVIAYGDTAEQITEFNPVEKMLSPSRLDTDGIHRGSNRRIDLALKKVARIYKFSEASHKIVILITAGKQLSSAEDDKETRDLRSASLQSLVDSNAKIVIIPIGIDVDFKELGLMIKRPQSLFPLLSFEDLPGAAQKIAAEIRKTADMEVYMKEKATKFSGVNPESGFGEKISDCLDVIEGLWYSLYEHQNTQSKRPSRKLGKVEALIRESIDELHGNLVSQSNVTISLAVFGPQGVGKSHLLNFLLNWGLEDDEKVQNGPLPSAEGGSRTPLPIHIKYGENVRVSVHQHREDLEQEWYNEELDNGTLADVKNLLNQKFEESEALEDATSIELQGPFPVFRYLKQSQRKITSTGHLELEVDIELVDLPGLGDPRGNELITSELSKADMVLFFKSSQAGRPVTSEDLASVFRRHKVFEYTSRPKLVHVFNASKEPSEGCDDFNLLHEKKKVNLKNAWSTLISAFSNEGEDGEDSYEEARKKLPQLGGNVLLEKLENESEVMIFHPGNDGFQDCLKSAIESHVKDVVIKNRTHPVLKDVHWVAKKQRKRISTSAPTSITKEADKAKTRDRADVIVPTFEVSSDLNEVKECVKSFRREKEGLLPEDFKCISKVLYSEFLYSEETLLFLSKCLQRSLENFAGRLISHEEGAHVAVSQEVPEDKEEMAEFICRGRITAFVEASSEGHIRQVLRQTEKRNSIARFKKEWSSCCEEEQQTLLKKLQRQILGDALELLGSLRSKTDKQSPLQLIDGLRRVVKTLFDLKSRTVSYNKSALLNATSAVIKVCTTAIRDTNPHPSLDTLELDHNAEFPDTMVQSREENIKTESSRGKIIHDMTQLLLKPTKRSTNPQRELEKKLQMKSRSLAPPLPEVDQGVWTKVLLKVLSDEEHFQEPPWRQAFFPDAVDGGLAEKARERLFAHRRSQMRCKIVEQQSCPENEIHLEKSSEEAYCLAALMCKQMRKEVEMIATQTADLAYQAAPIFMPTIRPGPSSDKTGNYLLQEDPWTKNVDENVEEEIEASALELCIFLVTEPQYLGTLKCTVARQQRATRSQIQVRYVCLPQNGRGIGVARAIIKSLAECLKFAVYWTIDDDVKFMYQFDQNDRRWHKCSIGRGLLFGQRVFQECQKKIVCPLSKDEKEDLVDDVLNLFPTWAKHSKRAVRSLLVDENKFKRLLENIADLQSPFTSSITSADCGDDACKEKELKDVENKFVDQCRSRLFKDLNHIAGVSLAHEATRRYDYMATHPSAHFMPSTQRYQVVLNNACALQGMNYVSDDMVFRDDDFQILDHEKRNNPYWGIKGEDKSFSRALAVNGVIGFQVICITFSHQKLLNVHNKIGPSYLMSPPSTQDEDTQQLELDQ